MIMIFWSTAYSFEGILIVSLLVICTCAYMRRVPRLRQWFLSERKGFWGVFYKGLLIVLFSLHVILMQRKPLHSKTGPKLFISWSYTNTRLPWTMIVFRVVVIDLLPVMHVIIVLRLSTFYVLSLVVIIKSTYCLQPLIIVLDTTGVNFQFGEWLVRI